MNANVPLEHVLVLAAVLFCLGLAGVLARRNVLFVIMSLEIMLNAAGLAFVAAGARWGTADGQAMFLFILAIAAVEVSIGLALVIRLYHDRHSLDTDRAGRLQG